MTKMTPYRESLVATVAENYARITGDVLEEKRRHAEALQGIKTEARRRWVESVRAARRAGVSWLKISELGGASRSTLQKLAKEYDIE